MSDEIFVKIVFQISLKLLTNMPATSPYVFFSLLSGFFFFFLFYYVNIHIWSASAP